MSIRSQFLTQTFLIVVLVCLSGCEAMLRFIPQRSLGPSPINPEFDAAAKAIEPEAGQSLLYVILEETKGDCASADVWLNGLEIGRVFLGEYLYAPTSVGQKVLKIQDYRIDRKTDRHSYHTILAEFTLVSGETSYLSLKPKRSEPCHLEKITVTGLSSQAGKALLSNTVLSRLNRHGFFERGMKTKSGTLPNKKDSCDGRLMADSNFTIPVACDYRTQKINFPEENTR
ncbi:MAG: hypothetical protein AAF438_17805 [Pseudomonadota bacterium]